MKINKRFFIIPFLSIFIPILALASTSKIKYDNIIITGNCPFTIALAYDEVYKKIIGVGPWAFLNSNMEVLRDMKPGIEKQITTKFINNDYKVNIESLINLRPGIIFHYGKHQNDHLERTGVPVVDLDAGGEIAYNPIATQKYWEDKYAEILGFKSENKFEGYWSYVLKEISPSVDKIKERKIRALFVHSSNDKQIRVSGTNTFGDSYLKISGLSNVADELNVAGSSGRFIDVSMEQVIKWNPDIIIVVFGSANKILDNSLEGQDWSGIKAVIDKKVFSAPVGIHNWGGMSGEAPLLPVYIISKLDDTLISDNKLKEMSRDFYKKVYNYNISDELLDDVLKQR